MDPTAVSSWYPLAIDAPVRLQRRAGGRADQYGRLHADVLAEPSLQRDPVVELRSDYVDSVYPAILNQPAKLTAKIHELRASSVSRPLSGRLGTLYREVRGDYYRQPSASRRSGDRPRDRTARPDRPARHRKPPDPERGLRRLSYAVAPDTELTLGARRFDYVKRDRGAVQVANVVSGTWADLCHRRPDRGARLEPEGPGQPPVRSDLFGYVQVSQGFRPGGVNVVPGLPETLAAYRSDRLEQLRTGSEGPDRRRARHRQPGRFIASNGRTCSTRPRPRTAPSPHVTNIGAARIHGLEIEATVRRAWGWDLAGSLTLTDARLTADQITNTAIGLGLEGDRLPVVPTVAAAASMERRWTLAEGLTGRLRLDGCARAWRARPSTPRTPTT
ncbi:hypothetical protein ACRAWD_18420 [Caulobacter segnis]